MVSQRVIYDARYAHTAYDERSAVRVLTAEALLLRHAVERALGANPTADMSIFDFGHGTGRVTNEFTVAYPHRRDLTVIAYDVSSVGLRKSADTLRANGFRVDTPFTWDDDARTGYRAGTLTRNRDGVDTRVVYVHGSEWDEPEALPAL